MRGKRDLMRGKRDLMRGKRDLGGWLHGYSLEMIRYKK